MKRTISFILILISLNLVMAGVGLPKCVSIDVEDQSTRKSKLYPNPAADFIIIKNSSNIKIKNISILSMLGSPMINKNILDSNSSQEINVSKMSTGRYFVKVSYVDGSQEILVLIKL